MPDVLSLTPSPHLFHGYVVAGGRSSRMGRDKALLPWGDTTLLDHALDVVRAVTPRVSILCGPTKRYDDHGAPVIVDEMCGAGPIGGLHAALVDASAAGAKGIVWLAIDIPNVPASLLRELMASLNENESDVVIPRTENGLEPLCAAFRVSPCLDAVRKATLNGRLGLRDAIDGLTIRETPRAAELFANVNTAEEFDRQRERAKSSSRG